MKCPSCKNKAELKEGVSYNVTGIVKKQVYQCANGYCGCLYILSDLSGTFTGGQNILFYKAWKIAPPSWTGDYQKLVDKGLLPPRKTNQDYRLEQYE